MGTSYIITNNLCPNISFPLNIESVKARMLQVLLLAASLALASATPVLKLDDLEYGFCPGSPEPGTFDSAKVSCDWWRAGHVTAVLISDWSRWSPSPCPWPRAQH